MSEQRIERDSLWSSKDGHFNVFVKDPNARMLFGEPLGADAMDMWRDAVTYTHADDDTVPPRNYTRTRSNFLCHFEMSGPS